MPTENDIAISLPPILLEQLRPDCDDQTVYIADSEIEMLGVLKEHFDKNEGKKSFDFSQKLKLSPKTSKARINACRCFNGKAWALTFREIGFHNDQGPARSNLESSTVWMNGQSNVLKSFAPSPLHIFKTVEDISLASIDEISQLLLQLLHENQSSSSLRTRRSSDTDGAYCQPGGEESKPHALKGLLFITGETDCGKSRIARGLIYKYLQERQKGPKERNPHLVTYENPIEQFFYEFSDFKNNGGFNSLLRRIDYTPRQWDSDCASLADCIDDALRQTPTVLFAGEIRKEKELVAAVNFGGTGHFIIATGHAGSLTEATEKLFSALKVTNAVQRAIHVPKILGIVHLKPKTAEMQLCDRLFNVKIVAPALYRRCPRGEQDLISDGLASFLPYCPRGDESASYGSLGRQFFVRRILERSNQALRISSDLETGTETAGEELKKIAEHWQALRGHHAGLTATLPDLGLFQKSKPFWISCAEDDLNGVS